MNKCQNNVPTYLNQRGKDMRATQSTGKVVGSPMDSVLAALVYVAGTGRFGRTGNTSLSMLGSMIREEQVHGIVLSRV